MTDRDPLEGPPPEEIEVSEEVSPEVSQDVPDEDGGRRYPSTIGGMCYLVVLVGTAVGIGIVWSGDWRLGTEWMAGALIFAALVRLVLPRRDAGMLAVRHRLFDVILLAGVGAIMIFLAITIPNQPT